MDAIKATQRLAETAIVLTSPEVSELIDYLHRSDEKITLDSQEFGGWVTALRLMNLCLMKRFCN